MLKAVIIFTATMLATVTPAVSQEVSDAALSECQSRHSSFTEVRDCLPKTEIAQRMLAVAITDEFFGPTASVIVAGCRDRNEFTPAAWACARAAIDDATELAELVGDLNAIEDQRFRTIANQETANRLMDRYRQERQAFGVSFSGGEMFFPLR